MITYVSAYFQITSAKRSVEEYKRYFEQLASTKIPIVLFLDANLKWTFSSNVRIIRIPKEDLWTYQHVPDNAQLPSQRDACDTLEYMRLMNSKSDLVYIASHINPFRTEWFAWIDFGIVHIFREPERTLQRISRLTPPSYPCMKTAGIWPYTPEDNFERISWRFAGGFFLIHKSLADKFHEGMCTLIKHKLPKFAWEVNLWAELEKTGFDFGWYASDHDDTIIY